MIQGLQFFPHSNQSHPRLTSVVQEMLSQIVGHDRHICQDQVPLENLE
jgi:hypothetical protein